MRSAVGYAVRSSELESSVRSFRVDRHLGGPYTTSLMAKTDLANGPRLGREPGSRHSWLYWAIATIVLLAGFADAGADGQRHSNWRLHLSGYRDTRDGHVDDEAPMSGAVAQDQS